MRPRILLAEHQSQVLQFLRLFPEYTCNVVGAVRDEQDLLAAAKALKPDIVIIDIDLPRLNGIESIRQLGKTAPNCRVILKSSHAKPESMAEAYTAGVWVYLVKEPSLSLALAIRAIIDQPRWTGEWKTVSSVENLDLTTHRCSLI